MLVEIENMITGEIEGEEILSEPLTEYNGDWIRALRAERAGHNRKVERMQQNNMVVSRVLENLTDD